MLGYVAQLIPPPPNADMVERVALHTVLRVPFNSFWHSDLFNLDSIECMKFWSFTVSCAAAMMRTALQTVTSWPKWKQQLEEAAKHTLNIAPILRVKLSPDFWDSAPIAANLADAFYGYPRNPLLAEGARRFYHNFSQKYPDLIIEPGCLVKF